MDDLSNFLEILFWKSPFCLALFAALIFVIARSERHPLVSVLAAIGFGWMLLVIVGEAAWRAFAVPDLFPDAGPPTDLGESLSYVAFSLLEAFGIGCIVAAIVLGRQPRRRPFLSRDDDDDQR